MSLCQNLLGRNWVLANTMELASVLNVALTSILIYFLKRRLPVPGTIVASCLEESLAKSTFFRKNVELKVFRGS